MSFWFAVTTADLYPLRVRTKQIHCLSIVSGRCGTHTLAVLVFDLHVLYLIERDLRRVTPQPKAQGLYADRLPPSVGSDRL